MEKLAGFHAFEWIQEETERLNFDNGAGSRVLNFIPHRFSYYCKIIHPIYWDEQIKDEKILWNQTAPQSFGNFQIGERLRLKDLADKYGLLHTKELSSRSIANKLGGYPRYVLSGEEGEIDPQTMESLISLLQPFTSEDKCYFQYHLLKTADYTDALYAGKLREVMGLSEAENLNGSPTYWWPVNKSWCLYTDFDLDFSLIGGSKEMIDELLDHSFLECIRVDGDTRVDNEADKKNQQ